MKRFYCRCGNQVFFDSQHCVHCGTQLGFDAESMEIRAVEGIADGYWEAPGVGRFRRCSNGLQFSVCNWLVPEHSSHTLCFGCQFNRTVPNQSMPGNRLRWQDLEEGKKRLFYTLLRLKLPLIDGWRDPERGLLLDFIEDQRSGNMFAETFVSTGYLGGVITINALEADDVARTAQREKMNESYRTVLGHMRHESGHYYWARLNPDASTRAEFGRMFGDETRDYQQALEQHYHNGPAPNWREHYISAYASSHPVEDWAETWGHYLHIYDALETASAHGVIDQSLASMTVSQRIALWRDFSITLNELNRSVGCGDAYPFVINASVEAKLLFVDDVMGQLQKLH